MIMLLALFLTGCATKQYPQTSPVTMEESSAYSCEYIDMELAKANSAKREILKTGEFNGKTVLGFLGDFGIGNGMAKRQALKNVNERIYGLTSLKNSKCSS